MCLARGAERVIKQSLNACRRRKKTEENCEGTAQTELSKEDSALALAIIAKKKRENLFIVAVKTKCSLNGVN